LSYVLRAPCAGVDVTRTDRSVVFFSTRLHLYFDFRNPNRAFVNIQHPASGVDRLIEIGGATSGAGEQVNPVNAATCRERGKWLRNFVL